MTTGTDALALTFDKTYAETVCCACHVFNAVREHDDTARDRGWCAICRDNVDFIFTNDDGETP